MGILRTLSPRANAPWDDFWFSGVAHPTASGVDVDTDSTLGLTAMWNGVHLIGNALAMAPLRLYRRRRGGGSDEAREDPRFRIVHRRPNRWQTAFGWRQMSQGHLLLRGNTYAQKLYRMSGSLDSIVPLHPTRMSVEVENGEVWYVYQRSDGTRRVFAASEILHIRGLSTDGIVGYCPVTVMRESLGAMIGTDTFAARFFRNNAQPKGALKTPHPLKTEAFKQLREEWNAAHAGVDNAHKVAVLDNGLEWQSIGFSAEDAQLLGSRTFNVQEAARILNIPPHKLKEMSRSTFSNIEHQNIEWVVDTIQPWVENWEQQLDADLLTEREQATMFFKFDLKALLRGDSAQRSAYMQARFNMGSLSPNDIRGLEDEDPIADKGGDRYYVQQNLMPLDKVDEILESKKTPPAAPPASAPDEPDDSLARLRAFAPAIRDTAARMLHREITAAKRAAKKQDWASFHVWADEYWGEAAGTAAQQLVPLAESMARTAGYDGPVSAYAAAAGQQSASESLAQVRDLLRVTEPEALQTALDTLFETWREERPEAIAAREVERAARMFTNALEAA
jgi:HK97 family phage portal protein